MVKSSYNNSLGGNLDNLLAGFYKTCREIG